MDAAGVCAQCSYYCTPGSLNDDGNDDGGDDDDADDKDGRKEKRRRTKL